MNDKLQEEKMNHDITSENNNLVKRAYIAPSIDVQIVYMEQGIANSSATAKPGGDTNTPTIEDWDEQEDVQNWNF